METTKVKSIAQDILSIKYQGKEYKIDVQRELSINEELVNSQLKDSPSSYAFLCLQRDKAIHQRNKLEREKDLAYSQAWVYYKESDSKMTNDMASHKAVSNKKYQSLLEKYEAAVYKADKLISICRAFESRERMLQTLSSNLRRQQ